MFYEELCKFLHSKLQIFKLQHLGLCILKITEIPDIVSTVKFFLEQQTLTGSLQIAALIGFLKGNRKV